MVCPDPTQESIHRSNIRRSAIRQYGGSHRQAHKKPHFGRLEKRQSSIATTAADIGEKASLLVVPGCAFTGSPQDSLGYHRLTEDKHKRGPPRRCDARRSKSIGLLCLDRSRQRSRSPRSQPRKARLSSSVSRRSVLARRCSRDIATRDAWITWASMRRLHLLDAASGQYNSHLIRPGISLHPGWQRMQGFIFRAGDVRLSGKIACDGSRCK